MCYVREHMKLQRGAGVRCVTGQSIRRAARSWCVLYEAAAESWSGERIRRAARSWRVLGIRSRSGKLACARAYGVR